MRDGGVVIRGWRPGDADRIAAAAGGLSPNSLYYRFLVGGSRLPAAYVRMLRSRDAAARDPADRAGPGCAGVARPYTAGVAGPYTAGVAGPYSAGVAGPYTAGVAGSYTAGVPGAASAGAGAFFAGRTTVATVGGQVVGWADHDQGEGALLVVDAWQRHGIGLRLARAGLARCQAEGIQTIRAIVHPENSAVRALLRSPGLAPWRITTHLVDDLLHVVLTAEPAPMLAG